MTLRRGAAVAFDDRSFVLCLTHDVDRPYKRVQGPYRALTEGDPRHLRPLVTEEEPYWRFEDVMAIESRFGVRSSFYFLDEKHVTDLPARRWFHPRNWLRFTGHYRLHDPPIRSIIRELDDAGWEIGIHGSYESATDPARFAREKTTLERVLGHPVRGGRQHFLNLDRPTTWRMHRRAGLEYDASLGSSTEYGFRHGYDVKRPFDDAFLVFPLTLMEVALLERSAGLEDAKAELDRLVAEAARHGAVMTVLWHVRLFNDEEFPGYRELYAHLLERAQDAGAWIGPVGGAHAVMTGRDARSQPLTAR